MSNDQKKPASGDSLLPGRAVAIDDDSDGAAKSDGAKRSVSQRLADLQNQKEINHIEKEEREAAQSKRAQEKEAADRRSQLLNAVRVSTPDISHPLFDKMKTLAYQDRGFSSRDAVELLKVANVSLKEAHDFFDLNPAQREDLLDRIGFYRGIVIDQSLSNPVEPGFREVLKRPDMADNEQQAPQTEAASVLYRRPNFSGYFENHFTSDESVHQMQKNGITNLSFSLAVSAGGLVKAGGVGISASTSQLENSSSGAIGKTIYTTANFFLPQIELSFDDAAPCANDKFMHACAHALTLQVADNNPNDATISAARFRALKKVLDTFGHFVASQTLIGGRLYATEEKVFVAGEKESDITSRFAGAVKASLATPSVGAEISASREVSTQNATSQKNANESQKLTFQAVGGEGAVVQNAALWAESLYDYRRWSVVQRENLIPTIDLLPQTLSEDAWALLAKYAANATKRQLLHEDNAAFLFYGAYGDKVGSLASEVYFTIENVARPAAISLSSFPPRQNDATILSRPALSHAQLWRLSAEGHLVSYITVQPGATGKRQNIAFALSVDRSEGDNTDSYPVVVKQLGRADHQRWNCSDAGEITCVGFASDYLLIAESAEKLVLAKRAGKAPLSLLWSFHEYSVEEIAALKPPAVADTLVKFLCANSKMVLSILEGAGKDHLQQGTSYTVCAQKDINGLHQLWRIGADGDIKSLLQTDASADIYLSTSGEAADPRLVASSYDNWRHQRWKSNFNDHLSPASGPFFNAKATIKRRDFCNAIEMTEDVSAADVIWKQVVTAVNPPIQTYESRTLTGNVHTEDVFTVDSRPLVVNGTLTSLQLFVTDRKMYNFMGLGAGEGYALQMHITADLAAGGNHVSSHIGAAPNASNQLFSEYAPVYIDEDFLYLPDWPIYAIRLSIEGDVRKVLTFSYQEHDKGPWISSGNGSQAKSQVPTEDLAVACEPIIRKALAAGETLIGIGLHYDSSKQLLAPKMLVSKPV
ncbi:hypothetical protein BTJ39_19110 [Izhakiella australiensis]|uniref:MACPF-like domain-containing protein n=1 Tax=Izhakiella australiensis TaxID=1926881 RepID=A0A1S8YGX8_9GAMM|nr:hypothetical protein [Izhakiella australiensis]OON38078.1 hypothetical protein BTJ39_19110 [Izhakiella australiensis]